MMTIRHLFRHHQVREDDRVEIPFGEIFRVRAKQIGEFHADRLNISIPPEKKDALLKKLAAEFDSVGSFKVEKFITTDGYKFLLPGGEWVAFRASGTEPLIRCYIEAKSGRNMRKLQEACRKVLAA